MSLLFFLILDEEQGRIIEQLFRKHNTQFHRIALRIVGSEASAEDAVSMAYIKIMDNIEKISSLPCPQMTAFCVTIVKNTSIDLLRQAKKLTPVECIDGFGDEDSRDIEEEFIKSFEVQRLSELLDNLSTEDRHLIQMRYAMEMSYRDIAHFLGISEDTAKKRGQRVIQKLKRLYEEEDAL